MSMKVLNHAEPQVDEVAQTADVDPLVSLVIGRTATTTESATFGGIVVGELVGMSDEGLTPLVVYPGQSGSAAIAARSVIDLHSAHVSKQVVLMFEGGDLVKPIIMGVLRDPQTSALEPRLGHVDVDVDGERMVVTAKQQLVLRCGKASITLTNVGKVLIEGEYVSSRSTGVNRVKGGSVQLN
jgi:hypothetical protein